MAGGNDNRFDDAVLRTGSAVLTPTTQRWLDSEPTIKEWRAIGDDHATFTFDLHEAPMGSEPVGVWWHERGLRMVRTSREAVGNEAAGGVSVKEVWAGFAASGKPFTLAVDPLRAPVWKGDLTDEEQAEALGEIDAWTLAEGAADEAPDDETTAEDNPPPCSDRHSHDWQSPHHIVGGVSENPGVWSKGGTTLVLLSVCSRCGAYRREVSHGPQRNPGQRDIVEYMEADERSNAWVESLGERDDDAE